jgi:hypothetical protein
MGTWIALWSDGDVTIVSAGSRNKAFLMLDEIGDPGQATLTKINDAFITLSPRIGRPVGGRPVVDFVEANADHRSESLMGALASVNEKAAAFKRRAQNVWRSRCKIKLTKNPTGPG